MFDLECYVIVHVKFKGTLDLASLRCSVFNIQKILIKVQMLTQQLIIYQPISLISWQLMTHNLIQGPAPDRFKQLDTLDIFPGL